MDYVIDELQLVDQVVLVFQVNQLVFAKKNNNKLKGVIFFAYFLYSFLDYQSLYALTSISGILRDKTMADKISN